MPVPVRASSPPVFPFEPSTDSASISRARRLLDAKRQKNPITASLEKETWLLGGYSFKFYSDEMETALNIIQELKKSCDSTKPRLKSEWENAYSKAMQVRERLGELEDLLLSPDNSGINEELIKKAETAFGQDYGALFLHLKNIEEIAGFKPTNQSGRLNLQKINYVLWAFGMPVLTALFFLIFFTKEIVSGARTLQEAVDISLKKSQKIAHDLRLSLASSPPPEQNKAFLELVENLLIASEKLRLWKESIKDAKKEAAQSANQQGAAELSTAIQSLTNRLDGIEVRIQSLNDLIDARFNRLSVPNERVGSQVVEEFRKEQLTSAINKLEGEKKQLQEELARLRVQPQLLEDALKAQTEVDQQSLIALQQAKVDMERQLELVKARHAQLKEANQQLHTQQQKVEAAYRQSQNELATTQQSLDALRLSKTKEEEKFEFLRGQLQEENKNLRTDLQRTGAKFSAKSRRIEALLQEKQQVVADADRQIKLLEQTSLELQKKCVSLQTQLTQAETELAVSRQATADAERQLKLAEQRYVQQQEIVAAQAREIEAVAQQSKEELKTTKKSFQSDKEKKERELNLAEQRYARSQSELATTHRSLEALRLVKTEKEKELELLREQLQKENESLRTNLQQAKTESLENRKRIEVLLQEKQQAATKADRKIKLLEQTSSALREKGKNLQTQITQANAELTVSRQTTADLERQLELAKQRHVQQQETVAAQAREIEVMAQQWKEELKTTRESFQLDKDGKEKELKRASQRYTQLQHELATIQESIDALRLVKVEEEKEFKRLTKQLQEENESLRTDLQQAKAESLAKSELIEALLQEKQQVVADADRQIKLLEQTSLELQEKCVSLQTQLTQAETELAASRQAQAAQAQAMEAETQRSKEELATIKTSLQTLQLNKANIEEELRRAKQSQAELQHENEDLELARQRNVQQQQESEKRLAELQQAKAESLAENERNRETLLANQEALAEKNEEINHLKTNSLALQKKYEDLQTQITQAETELAASRQAISDIEARANPLEETHQNLLPKGEESRTQQVVETEISAVRDQSEEESNAVEAHLERALQLTAGVRERLQKHKSQIQQEYDSRSPARMERTANALKEAKKIQIKLPRSAPSVAAQPKLLEKVRQKRLQEGKELPAQPVAGAEPSQHASAASPQAEESNALESKLERVRQIIDEAKANLAAPNEPTSSLTRTEGELEGNALLINELKSRQVELENKITELEAEKERYKAVVDAEEKTERERKRYEKRQQQKQKTALTNQRSNSAKSIVSNQSGSDSVLSSPSLSVAPISEDGLLGAIKKGKELNKDAVGLIEKLLGEMGVGKQDPSTWLPANQTEARRKVPKPLERYPSYLSISSGITLVDGEPAEDSDEGAVDELIQELAVAEAESPQDAIAVTLQREEEIEAVGRGLKKDQQTPAAKEVRVGGIEEEVKRAFGESIGRKQRILEKLRRLAMEEQNDSSPQEISRTNQELQESKALSDESERQQFERSRHEEPQQQEKQAALENQRRDSIASVTTIRSKSSSVISLSDPSYSNNFFVRESADDLTDDERKALRHDRENRFSSSTQATLVSEEELWSPVQNGEKPPLPANQAERKGAGARRFSKTGAPMVTKRSSIEDMNRERETKRTDARLTGIIQSLEGVIKTTEAAVQHPVTRRSANSSGYSKPLVLPKAVAVKGKTAESPKTVAQAKWRG